MDTSDFRGLWFISSGEQVQIGDVVTTDLDVTGRAEIVEINSTHGMPIVRVLSGVRAGDTIAMWPGRLLRKAPR